MDSTTVQQGKTIAIIAYITVIGLIVAYIMNSSKNNTFASFHIGQSVRILILGVANYMLGWVLPSSLSIVTTLISLGILVLIILGIINAANGEAKPLPIIGTLG